MYPGVKWFSRMRPRAKSPGTQISRRTVTRGIAWSAPVAAVAYAAPAFAASPPPVVASQRGVACKHPGASDDKTYHFTFCFKATGAIDGNLVTIGTMRVGADCREAYAASATSPSPFCPTRRRASYIDAPGFTESSTDRVSFTSATPSPVRRSRAVPPARCGRRVRHEVHTAAERTTRRLAARRRRRRRRRRPVHAGSDRLRSQSLRAQSLTIGRRSERLDEQRRLPS